GRRRSRRRALRHRLSDRHRGRKLMRQLLFAFGLLLCLATLPARADVDIQELTSPNGQEFWLVEEHAIPIVAIEVGFRGGSRLGPEGRAGLAEFMLGLMNEGAGETGGAAFANRADDVSAWLGFSAARDQVSVSGRFLS